jgi:hypothetical protein
VAHALRVIEFVINHANDGAVAISQAVIVTGINFGQVRTMFFSSQNHDPCVLVTQVKKFDS